MSSYADQMVRPSSRLPKDSRGRESLKRSVPQVENLLVRRRVPWSSNLASDVEGCRRISGCHKEGERHFSQRWGVIKEGEEVIASVLLHLLQKSKLTWNPVPIPVHKCGTLHHNSLDEATTNRRSSIHCWAMSVGPNWVNLVRSRILYFFGDHNPSWVGFAYGFFENLLTVWDN